jgi:glucosyl-3-phosphoglycerate phosphatase
VSGRRLLLLRHGVTDWNREGRFQGQLDPPLSADGLDEARRLAERIAADEGLRPAHVVTSSLSRASQTAELVASTCGATLGADARLVEVGQGAWEGRTHSELAKVDAARYAAWRDGGGRQPPGGESLDAVRDRVAAALDDLLGGEAWPLAIVSHGGTLRLFAGRLLELDAERAWALDLDNASLSALTQASDGAWRVDRWNDTLHLLGHQPTHVDEAEGRPLAL